MNITTSPMKIFISGPLSNGDSAPYSDQCLNVYEAMKCAVEVIQKGHRPFVPHLYWYIDIIAKKTQIDIPYQTWIELDKAFLKDCDALLCIGKSPGVEKELTAAMKMNIPIYYNTFDIPEMEKKTIYLIIGPSGSGKTTVIGQQLKAEGIPEVVSHTTRPARENEIHGLTYYFVTEDEFHEIPMIEVTEYDGNLYGTSIEQIEKGLSNNKAVFIIADKHGVQQFKKQYKDMCKVIYIYSSESDIITRMKLRGDSDEKIEQRLKHALANGEFENIGMADYCIVNKNMDETIAQLKSIINF